MSKDPYKITVQGIGWIGEGDATRTTEPHIYNRWKAMLSRVKGRPNHVSNERYTNVTVCERWKNFQFFCEDFKSMEHSGREGFELDKDLTVPNSKIYSPETCAFVPKEVNSLLLTTNKIRGKHPVGVHEKNSKNKTFFCAGIRKWGVKKSISLGSYDTPELAFSAYKKAKEDYIKEVAERHFQKGNISEKIYNNLINWEITEYPE